MTIYELKDWIHTSYIPDVKEYYSSVFEYNIFPEQLYQELINKEIYSIFYQSTAHFEEKKRVFIMIIRDLASVSPSLAVVVTIQMLFGIDTLRKYGTNEQLKICDAIAKGAIVSAAWNEDISGINFDLMTSKIIKQNNKNILAGKKTKILLADIADYLLIFTKEKACTDADKGNAILLLSTKQDGITITKDGQLRGLGKFNLNTIKFDNVELYQNDYIGEKTSVQFISENIMDEFKLLISIISLELAIKIMEKANEFFNYQRKFGLVLSDSPRIYEKTSDLMSQIWAAEALRDGIVIDGSNRSKIAAFKILVDKLLIEILDSLPDLIYKSKNEIELYRYFKDAKELIYLDGSIQSQYQIIHKNY